jgi:hypothetical protein
MESKLNFAIAGKMIYNADFTVIILETHIGKTD